MRKNNLIMNKMEIERKSIDELVKESERDLESVVEQEELEIDNKESRKIVWQAKDFSIREFASMLNDGDLDLQPEYQRKYVATKNIASKLIESILMDVPIPVIILQKNRIAPTALLMDNND
jgi:hypothetical protein